MAGLGIAVAMAAPTKVWGNSSMCYDFSMNWVGGVFLVLGFVVSSFWVWRKMRGEYEEEEILTMLLGVTGVGMLAAAWGWKWWSLWGIVVAVVATLVAWCRRKKWDIWEWLDVIVAASMVMGLAAAVGSGQWMKGGRLGIFLGVGLVGLWLVAKYYRRWSWYKSGKLGLVGLAGLGWWMGLGLVIANWPASGIYWAGLLGVSAVILWRRK